MIFSILIPPSEGKASSGHSPPLKKFSPTTEKLLALIEKTDPKKLYSAKTSDSTEINKAIRTAKTLPAIQRYTGVVFDALNYETLSPQEQEYINTRVRIVSALFGILKPLDLIPNYSLSIIKLGAAKLWKEENSQLLKEQFILDLLPDSHAKAVSYTNGVRIDFTYERNGKVVRAGHEGKRIKGVFVQWLAQNNITKVNQLYAFNEEGYKWNGTTFHKKA